VGVFKPKDLTHSLHHAAVLKKHLLLIESYEMENLQLDYHCTPG
jgi:hypothetical protein